MQSFSVSAIIFEHIGYNEANDCQNSDNRKESGQLAHHDSSEHDPESIHTPFYPCIDILVCCIYPIQILNLFLKLRLYKRRYLNCLLDVCLHILEGCLILLPFK